MKNNELLTVAEFANRAGLSKQRIYQLLDKKLSNYLKEVDGKKMLKIEGLELFDIQDYNQGLETALKDHIKDLQAEIETMKEELEILRGELTEKNKQINEKDNLIKDLLKKLDQSHILVSQQQTLALADKKAEGQQSQKIIEEPPAADQREDPEAHKPKKKKAKGKSRFLYRILNNRL